MLVGNSDQVVPAKLGRRLFESYQGPKRLWEVPNGTHASINREPVEFWDGVVAFWREADKEPVLK
jgi:pimeloyl-ACP methyl ester carboxylesterase